MDSTTKVALKSIEITGFKTFTDAVRIDFAEGLNALLVTTEYGIPSGWWDFFDAFLWLFGKQMWHGMQILFDDGVDFAEVKAAVTDEDGNEITIARKISKGKDASEFSAEGTDKKTALSRLEKYFQTDKKSTITFGKTKITVANEDKSLAMRADKLIGITTDKSGKKSKSLVLSRAECYDTENDNEEE